MNVSFGARLRPYRMVLVERGNWNGKQLLPRSYFDDIMRPHVAKDLALSSDAPTNDYLHIGTYGGESNHFSKAGPGVYGFNWWFNAKGANHPDKLTWPDAPATHSCRLAFMEIAAS